jgi:hypothetical protein
MKTRTPKQEITTQELRAWLKDKKITLDCGHRYQVHNFSSTMLVHCDGTTECHNCGF